MKAESKEWTIYGGNVRVVFNADAHTYKIHTADKTYRHPSVTSVLSVLGKGDALLNWAANQTADRVITLATDMGGNQFDQTGIVRLAEIARETWRETRQQAATIGSHVHSILADVLNGKPVVYPELPVDPWMIGSIKRAVDAGLQFFKEHSIAVVQVEMPRWSPTYGFVGTGDLIASIDNRLSVLDFKTGKGASYPEYFAQTAAYQLAYEEEYPEAKVEERWVVRVGKTGQLQSSTRSMAHHDGDKQAFLNTLAIFRWQKTLQTRTRFDGPVSAYGAAAEVEVDEAQPME